MSVVAAAVVGSAVVGAVSADRASSKAAKAQQAAADSANATQLEMFYQNRDDQQPWRDAGTVALQQLVDGTRPGADFNRDFTLADFRADPGYDFRVSEGTKAIEHSAAARGGVLSGATLKGINRNVQDVASNEYQNAYNRFNADRTSRFNRLSSLAGIGQTATNQVAAMGTNTANHIAENTLQAGNAGAARYVAQGNAINGGVQTIGNYFMSRQLANTTPASAATYSSQPYATGGFGSVGAETTYYG